MLQPTTITLSVQLPQSVYLLRLRVLGAWWRLGSSAIEPRILTEYELEPVRVIREAGV